VSETFEIQSHTGPYRVHFVDDGPARAQTLVSESAHFLIDSHVADLYADRLQDVLSAPSVQLIEANEHSKSLEEMPRYVQHLAARGFRRNSRLVAIGGGVIQDITCFLAATMMRGVDWSFFPTTLLAQADSCIGSKSSINVREAKNIMGTFTPPREVFIDVALLDTLAEHDVRSGVGEILKVHAIDGPASFDRLALDYDRLFKDKQTMIGYVRRALSIKKPYIEQDEFDRASRQIFNYGHSFGHAIETATDFAVPHGIAVTMGMDLANFAAWRLSLAGKDTFERMHPVLKRNYRGYETVPVPIDPFLAALRRDKKNVGTQEVTVIMPGQDGRPCHVRRAADQAFANACSEFLNTIRTH
jgi:3-dehydroquinate synthase